MSLLRRAMMRLKGSTPTPSQTASFSFTANYDSSADKNVMSINTSMAITSRGIGFCIHTPVVSSQSVGTTTAYTVSPYATYNDTVQMVIETVFPNGTTYTQTMDNILTAVGNEDYGRGLVCYIVLVDDIDSSGDPLYSYKASASDYCSAEETSMGATNINGSYTSSPTTVKSIIVPNSLNVGGNYIAYEYHSTSLPTGNYTFNVTLTGVLPTNESIYISNDGYIASGKDPNNDKNTLYYCSANRSKVQWNSGDSIFVDHMFKMNGSI